MLCSHLALLNLRIHHGFVGRSDVVVVVLSTFLCPKTIGKILDRVLRNIKADGLFGRTVGRLVAWSLGVVSGVEFTRRIENVVEDRAICAGRLCVVPLCLEV